MSRVRIIRGIMVALVAVLSVSAVQGGQGPSRRASLATVEGIVVSLDSIPGPQGGGLEVARVAIDEPEPRELMIVLAPKETLQEIEFEVQVGDRLRVRVFLSDEEPLLAHKVLNVSRGTMVRLRTLTRVPLWNGRGHWQGGPSRAHRGGPGRRGPRH